MKIHSLCAWNVSHLYPFYGTPNYTKKQEEDLLKQIPKESREELLDRIADKKLRQQPQGSTAAAAAEDDDMTVMMSEGVMDLEDCGDEEKAVEEEESRNEVASEAATPKVVRKRKERAEDKGDEDVTRTEVVTVPATQRRGRKRSSRDKEGGGADGNPKGRKQPRTTVSAEGTENSSTYDNNNNNTVGTKRNSSGKSDEGSRKRGRRGPVYFTGVLSSPEGIKWLEEFEKHRQESAKNKGKSDKPSTVAVCTSVGSLVLENKIDESQEELADPTDYFTVLGGVAEQYFTPYEDSSTFFC